MLHFVTSYMKQNKSRKQTPETAQYGLEIIYAIVLGLKRTSTEMLVRVAIKLHMTFSGDIPLADLFKNSYFFASLLFILTH